MLTVICWYIIKNLCGSNFGLKANFTLNCDDSYMGVEEYVTNVLMCINGASHPCLPSEKRPSSVLIRHRAPPTSPLPPQYLLYRPNSERIDDFFYRFRKQYIRLKFFILFLWCKINNKFFLLKINLAKQKHFKKKINQKK